MRGRGSNPPVYSTPKNSAAEEVDNAMDKVVDMILNYASDFESDPVDALMDMASDGSLRRIQKYCDELGEWYGRM